MQRDPSTIGTSLRARNRSTVRSVQRLAVPEPVDRQLALRGGGGHAASSWRCAPRGPARARPAAAAPSSSSGTRVASSSTRQRAGANRRASTDIRIGSPTRSRRRAWGRATTPGTTPMPCAVHLGLGDPVRDEVMEQHHSLGQGHRPRRPGHHARRQVRRDVEQVQHPGELADVPAGDRQRRRSLEEVLDLLTVAGHRRSLLRAPGVVERLLELSHPLQVLFVQQLHDAAARRSVPARAAGASHRSDGRRRTPH